MSDVKCPFPYSAYTITKEPFTVNPLTFQSRVSRQSSDSPTDTIKIGSAIDPPSRPTPAKHLLQIAVAGYEKENILVSKVDSILMIELRPSGEYTPGIQHHHGIKCKEISLAFDLRHVFPDAVCFDVDYEATLKDGILAVSFDHVSKPSKVVSITVA